MPRALINVPASAKKGDVIDIKVLISHPMESGYRVTADGARIPRHLITQVVCRFGDTEVFRAELFPAIAANPFFAFTMVAESSGDLTFEWVDDKGEAGAETAKIVVT